MALNGDDGKIYVYEANASVWEPLKPLEQERGQQYVDTIKAIGDAIIRQNQKVYTRETMPKMNYTVTFNEIKLDLLSQKFLYSDETKVIDNNTSEVIAYNRRIMHFFYNIAPDLALGNRDYEPEPMCGFRFTRDFDEMVFPSLKYLYLGEVGSSSYKENQNKHTTGEK